MDFFGYAAAILMGVALGLVGGGGSILTVPILVYLFRHDPLVATTESLLIVGATALVGVTTYAKKGLVDFKTGLIFAIPSFIGVFVARKVLLPSIPDSVFTVFEFTVTKSLLVLLSFAALMIFASVSMIRPKSKKSADDRGNKKHVLAVALRGAFVGVVTGFVGAGGGFLIIPALVVLLNLPMRVAVGTSLGIIALNSLFGFFVSYSSHPLEWKIITSVAGLGIFGLLIGQRFSSSIDERKLKTSFGYFVLLVGLFVFLDPFLASFRI